MNRREWVILIFVVIVLLCTCVRRVGAQPYPPEEPTVSYVYLPTVVRQDTIIGDPICIPEPDCLPHHDYDEEN